MGALLLLGLPVIVPSGSVERVMTGVVVEVEGDDWLSVVNERSGQPIRFTLQEDLRVKGRMRGEGQVARRLLKLVAISYRVVGERHSVATRLRLLDDGPTR